MIHTHSSNLVLLARVAVLAICALIPHLAGCRSKNSTSATTGSAEIQLGIGSKAPSLKPGQWYSGTRALPETYSEGHVYVVLFWETWAPQCLEPLPALISLQQEFGNPQTHFALVTTERPREVEDYLTKTTLTKTNLNSGVDDNSGNASNGERLKHFSIALDDSRSLRSAFMDASGQMAIPTTFLVGKTGEIEWIGHPSSLPSVLQEVIEDRWTRDRFLNSDAATVNPSIANRELTQKLAAITSASSKRDSETSLEELDNLAKEYQGIPAKRKIARAKFDIALARNSPQLREAFHECATLEAQDADTLNSLTWRVYEHFEATKKIDPDLLRQAITYAEKAVSMKPDNGAILDTLAHLLYVDGQKERALEIQRKAAKNAGPFKDEIETFLKKLESETTTSKS